MDLYYSLFGSKVPNCLAKNEVPLSSGLPKIPKIPKLSDNKPSANPFDSIVPKKPPPEEPVEIQETFKRESESSNKPIEVKEEPTESSTKVNYLNIVFNQFSFITFAHLICCRFHSIDGKTRSK